MSEFQALPDGGWSHGGEYVVEQCPNCSRRNKLYLNVAKGMGFCYACEVKIYGQEGLNRWYPELVGQHRMPRPTMRLGPSPAILQPSVFGYHAWDHEDTRWWLVEKGVPEHVSREIPIMWIPSENVMAVTMDPLSSEVLPHTWQRDVRQADNKWRPAAGGHSAYYAFGVDRKSVV